MPKPKKLKDLKAPHDGGDIIGIPRPREERLTAGFMYDDGKHKLAAQLGVPVAKLPPTHTVALVLGIVFLMSVSGIVTYVFWSADADAKSHVLGSKQKPDQEVPRLTPSRDKI